MRMPPNPRQDDNGFSLGYYFVRGTTSSAGRWGSSSGAAVQAAHAEPHRVHSFHPVFFRGALLALFALRVLLGAIACSPILRALFS